MLMQQLCGPVPLYSGVVPCEHSIYLGAVKRRTIAGWIRMNFYGKKILFVVNNDWYFLSHRLDIARAARDYGAKVVVVARDNGHREAITRERFRFYPSVNMEGDNTDPVHEVRTVAEIASILMREKPDIVHNVGLKPILDGTIAARFAKVPAVLNTMGGLGYLFTEHTIKTKTLRTIVLSLMKVFNNPGRTITVFMNPQDANLFTKSQVLPRKQVRLIRGSGVDINRFDYEPEHEGWPVVSLVSRMLWNKGVDEFVEAARILRGRGLQARFQLVGDPDPGNTSSVPKNTLEQWDALGYVEYMGYRADIPMILKRSHIVCLPSYREGLPKSLLEAASAGRPIVTTDVPGTREIVRDGVNGLLVPVKDANRLADALQRLIENKEERVRMGKTGRRLAEKYFSMEYVRGKYMKLYERLLTSA